MRAGNLLTSASAAPEAMVASQQHSAWHSPVPYLFGGLAAMLGLIAFALLILACSYWKLSSHLESGNDGSGVGGDAVADADAGKPGTAKAAPHLLEHGYVVIMAGDEKPTFLATPTSKPASFGDGNKSKGTEEEEKAADDEKRTGEEAAAGDQPNADEADQHPTEEETHDHEHRQAEAQENLDRRYLHSPGGRILTVPCSNSAILYPSTRSMRIGVLQFL